MSPVTRRKSNRWHRPTIVAGILCGSVVARTNRTPGRRLLEDLQQRVERLAGQPLRLVDDVDLLAALRGRGGRALAKLPGVLDAAVGRRVDLDDVQVLAVADPDALLALVARLGGRALHAVDHLRQDPGGGGLARAPRTAEQVGVGQPALADRADQGPHDVLLPDDLARRLRAVLPVQRPVLAWLNHEDTPGGKGRPSADSTRPADKRKVVTVHPPLTTDGSSVSPRRRLRPGHPAAPASARLPLLPSGPDGVRELASRRTRPSTPPNAGPLGPSGPKAAFGPARADCGYRAPLAPRLARSPAEYTNRVAVCSTIHPCDAAFGAPVGRRPSPPPSRRARFAHTATGFQWRVKPPPRARGSSFLEACVLGLPTIAAVACPSGRRGTPGKRVEGQLSPGFESRSHRQDRSLQLKLRKRGRADEGERLESV